MTRPAVLTNSEVTNWVSAHPPWTLVDGHLVAHFELPYERGVQVLRLTEPDVMTLNHHPVATVRYGALSVDMFTDDQRGITELDLQVAQRFSDAVAEAVAG